MSEATSSAWLSAARRQEHDMKATNFLLQEPSLTGAWAKLAHALAFYPQPREGKPHDASEQPTETKPGFFERLDRWFWNQEMKEREAWLAESKDIFELEQRMRMLERVGSRYY
jgi:Protein of unknown function (DUF3563)